jgi:arylsulfatase A-like enzyme
VLPTLLELLGLEGVESAFAGRSFRAVVEGDAERHREAIIAGYHEGVDRVVRDAKHSLILRPEGEPDELYDLTEDPREQHNLIDERHEVAVELARRFGRPFFRRRPPQIHGVQGKYEILAGTA